ncbi:TspO/MBR family protein [Phormidium tenue FACHB-886]|nr:TspO/MBR family protein [Phormidium tenue FACHB-886]
MIRPWMIIGGVTFVLAMAIGSIVTPKGVQWFRRLRRPAWLTFEKAIPVIWTIVFTCGAWSATLVWQQDPGSSRTWLLMAFYLLLELVTLSYNPAMLLTRHLRVGTAIGGTGAVLGLVLAILVSQVSGTAALLLLPYLIWAPIGTYTTWEMARLNPQDA